MRAIHARSSSAERALASENIGCGWVTFSSRETGSPPTRCVGESGVTQLGVLGLDPRAARRAARRRRRRRPRGRRGRSSGGCGARAARAAPRRGPPRPRRSPRGTVRASLHVPRRGRQQPREVVGAQRLQARLVGEVEVQRRDGDPARGDRREIGALLVGGSRARRRRSGSAGGRPPRPRARAGRGRCACRAARPRRRRSSPAGTLMFSSVPAGSGTSSISSTMRAVNAAAASKSKRSPSRKSISRAADCWETATAGRPRITPSSAAATVPEYVMSSPRLEPWLMPRDDQLGREALDEAERGEAHAVDRRAVGGVADACRRRSRPPRTHSGRRVVMPRADRRAVGVGRDDRELDARARPAARGAAPAGPRPRSRRRW